MDVDKLINYVFARKSLWDQKHSQHHNRFVLDKKWDEVAEKMKTTRNAVRAKWKSLRDTYRKEIKKLPENQSVDESIWQSSWQHFKSLSFIREQFIVLPGSENVCSTGHEDLSHGDNEISISSGSIQDDCTNIPLLSAQEEIEPSSTKHPDNTLKRKRPNGGSIGPSLLQLEETQLESLEKLNRNTPDEDVSFFNSLLPHIKTLSPADKLLLRIDIQGLVYNFIYGNKIRTNNHLNQFVATSTIPERRRTSEVCRGVHKRNHLHFTELQECSNPLSSHSDIESQHE